MMRIYSEYKHFSYTYVSHTSKAYLGGRELKSYSSEEVVEIIKKQYDVLYEIVARQEESKNV